MLSHLHTHSTNPSSLTFCVIKGDYEIFEISICSTRSHSAGLILVNFARDFCPAPEPRNPTTLIGCGKRKKNRTSRFNNPTRILMNFTNCFPVYRFNRSKCSTNNSVLNAIDELNGHKKASQFRFTHTSKA